MRSLEADAGSGTPRDRRYDPAAYGDACADFYDEIYPRLPAPALSVLREFANGQALLDLGVGTGRAAIPLVRHGHEVWGIDASRAMLQRLRERAGGLPITAVHADLARFRLPQRFGLVFSLVNTLALLPPPDQLQCVRRAASHLRQGGRLLIESIGATADQEILTSISTAAGPRDYRLRLFASTPQHLDAMALGSGLVLQARWRDWLGTPWCASAAHCIAVYGLP